MFFGSDRHLTEEGIALFVDALKLNCVDRLPEEIREHVSECEECKRDVLEAESLVDGRRYRRIYTHPTFGEVRKRRAFPAPYRIAASILALVGVGWLAYVLGLFEGGQKPPATAAQTVQVSEETTAVQGPAAAQKPGPESENIAANFEPSPNLEPAINGTLRSEEVRILSPANGAVVRGDIVFRWETTASGPFKLKVVNNREFEQASVSLNAQRYVFRKKLASGLYYWKLEAGGDLLCVGKFVVRGK